MKRVYYHYRECEEFEAGLWRIVGGLQRQGFIRASAALMADPPTFRDAMLRAVREWPRSCTANLSASSMNRRAWLGHAGCLLATGSPEELTRLGWHTLDERQQNAANAVADEAIAEWERNHQGRTEDLGIVQLLLLGGENVA